MTGMDQDAIREDAASQKFRAGEIVRLKSGGPKMIVSHREGDGQCWCQWFDQRGVDHFECFAYRVLEWVPR